MPVPATPRRRGRDEALREFAARARTAARGPALDAVAVELSRALRERGVRPIALKGVALARLLYRPEETRGYFDVDLLVDEDQLPAVGRLLAERGFAGLAARGQQLDLDGGAHAETWSRWQDGVGNVTIDVHWTLPGCHAGAARTWAVLDRRRATVQVAGASLDVLDGPGLALHLALHAAQLGHRDAKALGDLKRGLERWDAEVWVHAAGLARELGACEALAVGLRLLPAGAVLADVLELPAGAIVPWVLADDPARPPGAVHLRALADAGGAGARLRIVRAALLPPRDWFLWRQAWAGRTPVHLAIARALHIVRAPAWALRAWRYGRRPSAPEAVSSRPSRRSR